MSIIWSLEGGMSDKKMLLIRFFAILLVGMVIGWIVSQVASCDTRQKNETLQTQLTSARDEVAKSRSDNDALKANYTKLSSDYTTLKTQYTQLNSDNEALKAKYAKLNSDYEALKSQYTQLDSDYNTLKSQYTRLKSIYDVLVIQYDALKKIMDEISKVLSSG
jgi:chromosome segregation ATPase